MTEYLDLEDLLAAATAALAQAPAVRDLGILEAEQFKPNKKPRRNDRVIARLNESKPGETRLG